MPTPRFIKDLWMLQETANGNLEVGANLVRKADIDFHFQPSDDPDGKIDWESIASALKEWETEGYIRILADPLTCKHKDYCFQILQPITAIPLPPDLLDD
jgi:hypothetical protein